jgi:hypothetical protein
VQQKCSKRIPPAVVQSERVRTTSAAHWRTLGAALAELGWPWLRLHGELISGRLAYRTYPPGHVIDWSSRSLRVDLTESTVTFMVRCSIGLASTTVAVEVLLPVGRRPPAAAIKPSWRDRPDEKALENEMRDIAQSYEGKPLPSFDVVWTKLKACWPDFPRDEARRALASYAAQLKRKPGQTLKTKSRS